MSSKEGRSYIPLLEENYPLHNNAYQQYPPCLGYPPPEGAKYGLSLYYLPPKHQPYTSATKIVPVTQQQSSNVIVIQSQPTQVFAKTVTYHPNDHYLKLSITLTFIWLYLGNWSSVFCTIPAITFSKSAIFAQKQGDIKGAKFKGQVSLILNIISIIWFVISIITIIITASVIATSGSSSDFSYYYTYYYYNDYYDYFDCNTDSYC